MTIEYCNKWSEVCFYLLFDKSVCQVNMSEWHSEGPAPNLQFVDVKDGGFVLGKQEDNVLAWEEPLEADLGFEVGSGDVGDDDSIRPEEDIRSLSVMGKVLDVDRLLVNDEDVSGDPVGCVLECSKVERFWLCLAISDHTQG